MKLIIIFSLLSLFGYTRSELVGGIPVSEWSNKCKEYFKTHGSKAADLPIHIEGYCQEFTCQKYSKASYGMKINECGEKFLNTKCTPLPGNSNLKYPDCCPQYDCED